MARFAFFSKNSQSIKSSFSEWACSEFHITSRPKHSIVEVRTGYNHPSASETSMPPPTTTPLKPRSKARIPRSFYDRTFGMAHS